MLKIIKNGEVYAPHYLGKKDVLLAFDKIVAIEDKIDSPQDFVEVEIIDATNKLIIPGLIDSHVHIAGGGGEGSFKTRTPEIQLTDITRGGVTTVVGCLGTDGTTRSMLNLLAKAKGLEEEGISTYIYTGSYQIPVKTATGNIEDDMIMVDKVIGVGEVALSDHRSSQPTVEEFKKLAAAARVGGMLSGKSGKVNIHLGDGERAIAYIEEIVSTTEIPITQFIPTHMNRNEDLFEKAIEHGLKGGIVDLTTSTTAKFLEEGEVKSSKALRKLLEHKVAIENITFSSDGQGSLPVFNDKGEYTGLKVGRVASLYEAVKDAILEEKVQIEKVLQVVTSNPATLLKLPRKGYIKENYDADLVLLNKDSLEIDTVIAMGKTMIEKGEVMIKGTFEA
ncbi:MAG: beta-aspartyl-peptidase [Clostridiaceae bacterium]|nr:beta-aspartyl-peptidase [Clostridiaceae bacterium]